MGKISFYDIRAYFDIPVGVSTKSCKKEIIILRCTKECKRN